MALAPATVPATAATPPTAPEPDSEPEAPERRLAEFSFAMFVTIELEVDPGEFSCSEPEAEDNEITCFALVDGNRVIVAVTSSSGGSGVFDWQVVSDHPLTASPSSTPTSTTVAPIPVANTNLSDSAMLSYGETLNRGADQFIDDLVDSAEGTVTVVNLYGWDPATATLTLDVTLDPAQGPDPDRAAWIMAQFLKAHWLRGQPFRLDGATLRPALELVVNATRYSSDLDLMIRVADQLITNTDWVAAARQT